MQVVSLPAVGRKKPNGLPVVIIGAGPAGLMAAEVLAQAGYQVQVYEQKPSAARKFLMAGKTGLNISHDEDFEQFILRYDRADWLKPMLAQFKAADIQHWMQGLGIESYVGSSGRIFPREMKAAPLLRAWLSRLKALGVQFFYRHQWTGWATQQQLQFNDPDGSKLVEAGIIILATGGGSWARLGSDAAWLAMLQAEHIPVVPLQPSNAGVLVSWSDFMQPLAGQPLKRVKAWVESGQIYPGEAVISHYGLEGGLIYRLNRGLRQQLEQQGSATIQLDLLPDVSMDTLIQKLQPSTKQSLNTLWRKAGLDAIKAALIREFLPKACWQNAEQVSRTIKSLSIPVTGFRPIDEAISTTGGVSIAALDKNLMLTQKPGVFCCGEMLDWDAPTGGYLLTACLATGRQAALGVMDWLQHQ
ncbi:TIGR03862 family flavoprotein [Alkanindiges sp. WGS2144]|uniref:TIGR03862 family flavoprotein n=1 Tax=Alkanindiges sp. WGS2144 TaxID=3366808 RepID=UPI003751FEC1